MRRSFAGILALALALLLAAPAQAAPVIRGSGVSWSPATLRVDRGTVVRWTGVSGTHRVRAYGGNWTFDRSLPAGEKVKRRFDRSGTFRFFCTIHASVSGGACSGMCGRVIVRR
jgi:plastocyanin